MSDPATRLLRLLSLLQGRRFWNAGELSARLEVSERTVRRDVECLRSLGYPVDASVGVAGGYQLGVGASLPPLLLDDEEALAVALGLRVAAAGGVAGIEEATVRALAKIQQMLPTRLLKKMRALSGAVASIYIGGAVVDVSVLATLANAFRAQETVRFSYCDAHGKESRRHGEPHGLVHAGTRWYLLSWDLERTDWRTFRVDRMTGKVTAGEGFSPRAVPGGSAAKFVADAVTHDREGIQAKILFEAPLETISRRVPASVGNVEAVDEHSCILSTSGRRPEVLAMHLANVGEDFQVLAPPALAEAVGELGKRLTRAAVASRSSPA